MNIKKGATRTGVILSVLWVIYQFVKHEQWISTEVYFRFDDFIIEGIVPLVIIWGLFWIVYGFTTEDNEQDK